MKLIGTFTDRDEEIIAENEKWFKFFVYLPKITTIILAIACFVLGIALATEDAIFLLAFWLGGAVGCALTYVILKLALSYKILHIYYLKGILYNDVSYDYEEEEEEPEELPEI